MMSASGINVVFSIAEELMLSASRNYRNSGLE